MRLGFIGLGVMGRPMALHLLSAGHTLTVWSRRPESAAPLLAAGARSVTTLAELGERSSVVFTMVTGSADVEALVLGEAGKPGLIAGMAPGSILVDCSTIAPASARHLGKCLAERGLAFLDAPVSGGGQGAIEANLAIMAGGEAAVLEQVRPLLSCFGKRIVHVGPQGAGQVAKACNQMIMVAAIEALAEAFLLSTAGGVAPERLKAALTAGAAASRVLEVMGERMVRRDFSAGIEARLHHKDFGLLLEAARRSGVALPLAAQVGQQLNALMASGYGHGDTSSLLRVLENTV